MVNNPNAKPFHFTTKLAAGDASRYLVVPDSGFVLASRQVALSVYSKPIPAVSATTDNLYGETLTVTTDADGDAPHEVAITQTAHGAILSFSLPAIDFPSPSVIGSAAQNASLNDHQRRQQLEHGHARRHRLLVRAGGDRATDRRGHVSARHPARVHGEGGRQDPRQR